MDFDTYDGAPYLLPSDTWVPAALHGDYSNVSPEEQKISRPDTDASGVYGQASMPYFDQDKKYPHALSPEDPYDPSIDPCIYHVSGHNPVFNNITHNTTINGPLNGPHSNTFTQYEGQQQQRPYPPLPAVPQTRPASHQQNNTFNFNQPYENIYNNPQKRSLSPRSRARPVMTTRTAGATRRNERSLEET